MNERRTKYKRKVEDSLMPSSAFTQMATTDEGKTLPHIVELGKFFIDIVKLIFGGVILTILLDYRDYKLPLFVSGMVTIVFFVILGTMIIKKANIK